jgi:hypothetical protein
MRASLYRRTDTITQHHCYFVDDNAIQHSAIVYTADVSVAFEHQYVIIDSSTGKWHLLNLELYGSTMGITLSCNGEHQVVWNMSPYFEAVLRCAMFNALADLTINWGSDALHMSQPSRSRKGMNSMNILTCKMSHFSTSKLKRKAKRRGLKEKYHSNIKD